MANDRFGSAAGKRVLVAKAAVMRPVEQLRYWGSRFGTYCWREYIQQGVEAGEIIQSARCPASAKARPITLATPLVRPFSSLLSQQGC
jgi:hypothetical protein